MQLMPSFAVADPRHFLTRAAQALAAEAMTFSSTIESTIAAVIPELGDFGFFEVFDGERLRCVGHADQDDHFRVELRRMAVAREKGDFNTFSALRSGVASLHLNRGSEPIGAERTTNSNIVSYPFEFQSSITVPMHYRGELVGAITLFMGHSGRLHNANDLACAQELAMIASPIVVNSRLVEQHINAREALQKSEEFLRTATEAGELGLWEWDIPNDRITCSERLYDLHGLPPDSPVRRSGDFIALVHPEDIAHVNARREAAFAGPGDYIVEFRPIRPDGRLCWLSARAHVFRDVLGNPVRMIGATVDITSRVEMLARERSLRAEAEAARQRLELLAEASVRLSASLNPEATLAAIAEVVVPRLADWCVIYLVDLDGESDRILAYHADPERARAGEAAARRLRSSPDTVGSLGWSVVTGQSHRSTGHAKSGDSELIAFAQIVGMCASCVVPLTARGRRIGAMAMLQAESGRTFSEDDLSMLEVLAQRSAVALDNARLFAEAEHARQAAEHASRAKDEFLAMLGHELRNPLAPIVTNLRLMELHGDAEFDRERRVIERQVSNLSRLVDDLLDVARITRGDVQLRKKRVLLRDVLTRAVETVTPLLELRRHRLELDLPDRCGEESDLVLDADEDRLVQVFSNLLSNAARYTPDGGEILLQASSDDHRCEIAVIDNGQGIAKDLLPRVFEFFFQGPQRLDRSNGGLGIGLALVKNLVGLHGGEVDVFSDGTGLGSKFVVTLPLSAHGTSPILSSAPTVAALGSSTSRRILLVDDNRDALESLAALLAMNGHEVRTASDPITAMALAVEFEAEVAILDIGLPGMDGYELGSRLRAAGSACRLVALMGYGLAEDRAKSQACGFEKHFVKPISSDALLDFLAD